MNALSLLWTKILRFVTIINFPTDILDVAIVAFIIYKLLNLSRSRTVTQVVKAVVVLLVISYISDALGLRLTTTDSGTYSAPEPQCIRNIADDQQHHHSLDHLGHRPGTG